eukprot:scaffold9571_cov153-Cylindrotheca_fusiformis.AAC.3
MNSDSASVKEFVQHVHAHLDANNVFAQIDQISNSTESTRDSTTNKDAADRLDKLVTQALLSAERKVAKPPKPP